MAPYYRRVMPSGPLVVAGAFGVDTNVYVTGARVGAETTFAHITDGLGQAGCYSALSAAALGIPARAIAALGADRLGDWVREELTTRGVALTELREPLGTHRSVNLVAEDGTRRNFLDVRAVSEVAVDLEACRAALRGARALHCHLDDWCRQLLPVALDEGVVVSTDLQDVTDLNDPYRADFVAAADIIFMSGTNLEDPAAAALELASRRQGRTVIVTLGAAGCLVASDGRVRRFPAVELPDPVIDTNGAGDNLAIGFLAARVLAGLPLGRAVDRAQLAARWICAQRGDEKTPLSGEQLEELEERLGGR